MWEAAPCSTLPTADENAVTLTESAVTTVYSSLFQSATVPTKNEFLYCSVLLSGILKQQELRILCLEMVLSESQSLKVVRPRRILLFLSAGIRKLSGGMAGMWSQSCRGLSAAAASFVPAVVAVLAPEHVSHTSSLSHPVVPLDEAGCLALYPL